MIKFVCAGAYVRIDTAKGPYNGIVESVDPKSQVAVIKTAIGTHIRNYKDLTIISYKGVM